jgi:hypothetical protein
MKKILRKFEQWIDPMMMAASILVILPLLLIGLYNQPSTDDFDYANLALEKGFWGAQISNYLSWAGRYFSTLLLTNSPLVFHSYLGYKLLCIAMLLGTLLVFYWFTGKAAPDLDGKTRAELTCVFTALYVLQMPSLSQGFYWMTGAVTYQAANLLTLLFWGSWIDHLKTGRTFFWALCALCLFGIVGSNETSMVLMDFALLSAIVFGAWTQGRVRPGLLALFVLALLLSGVVVLAPGNGHRETFFPDRHRLGHSLDLVLVGGLQQVLYWVRGHKGIFCIEFLVFDLIFRKVAANWKGSVLKEGVTLRAVTIFLLLAPFCGLIPAAWAMGMSPPARTANVLYFHFLIGVLCTFILLALHWKASRNAYDRVAIFLRPLLFVLGVTLIALGPNNITRTYDDLLSGRAKGYQQQMTERRGIVSGFQGQVCVLQPIHDRPFVLYFEDIAPDADDWKNTAFSKYYGKKCVLAPLASR